MIRINLLTSERKVVKKKVAFQLAQKLTLGCTLILIASALVIGWRYWSLNKESARLDAEIASAQTETARLHSIISQVQQFEQRRAQLQQRVALIDQLRKDQSGPVHMLDQISRALPPMLWLTDLKQGADPNEVLIEGKCTTQNGVSDFVANLEGSGYFKKSVDIVSSVTEPMAQPPGELVRFTLHAVFQQPASTAKGAPAAGSAGPKAGAVD
jgi:type IV pilus assembly protein PilN